MKLSNEHPAHPEWVDPFDRSYVKSMAQAILSPLARESRGGRRSMTDPPDSPKYSDT